MPQHPLILPRIALAPQLSPGPYPSLLPTSSPVVCTVARACANTQSCPPLSPAQGPSKAPTDLRTEFEFHSLLPPPPCLPSFLIFFTLTKVLSSLRQIFEVLRYLYKLVPLPSKLLLILNNPTLEDFPDLPQAQAMLSSPGTKWAHSSPPHRSADIIYTSFSPLPKPSGSETTSNPLLGPCHLPL